MKPNVHPSSTTTEQAIALLEKGGVGVIATDTVYGLVARAHDKVAVAHLYALKHRDHKPGTLIAASIEQLLALGVDESRLYKVQQWWPGPLSIILPVGKAFAYLHQGVGDVAIRITADEHLRDVLLQTGPLITSSANHPGKPGSVTIDEAKGYFKDTVDFYVDAGDLSGHAPSTIARIGDTGNVEILRQGAFHFS